MPSILGANTLSSGFNIDNSKIFTYELSSNPFLKTPQIPTNSRSGNISRRRDKQSVESIPLLNDIDSGSVEFLICFWKADLSNFLNSNINIRKFKLDHLESKYISEAKRLLPDKNYIGFSLTQGNEYRKKSWSVNNFITLANKINEKNLVPVFFIEKKEIRLINEIKLSLPNALFPEHQSKISCPALVTALSSRLSKAVTIDNGIMHMISLANIPMIVLFGPTDPKKFTPKIDNIKVIDSKEIYKSKNINNITVHDVFKVI